MGTLTSWFQVTHYNQHTNSAHLMSQMHYKRQGARTRTDEKKKTTGYRQRVSYLIGVLSPVNH